MDIEKLKNATEVKISLLSTEDVDYRMINDIMEKHQLSPSQLGVILGVRTSTIEHWASKSYTIPSVAKMLIALICAYPEVIEKIVSVEIIENGEIIARL